MLFLYNTHPPNILRSKILRERIILKIHRKPVKHTFIELVIDEKENKDLRQDGGNSLLYFVGYLISGRIMRPYYNYIQPEQCSRFLRTA